MTACAMTVGMVPMALALEKGSQMQAPLGLAVIGGLVMSTFATLLVLPSIFAVVIGNKVARSASVYPDDPDSAHYDPNVYAQAAIPEPVVSLPPGMRHDEAEVTIAPLAIEPILSLPPIDGNGHVPDGSPGPDEPHPW